MICCVIGNLNWLVGIDLHDGYPAFPLPLPKVPFAPHGVVARVRWGPWFYARTNECRSVKTPEGNAMTAIFDIGPFIPHVTLPVFNHWALMLLYSLATSSQGHFGASTVYAESNPVAGALCFTTNPQLDCGMPVPTPTGKVTTFNTVQVGLTLGDIFAGLISMAATAIVTAGIQYVTNNALSWMGAGLVRILPLRTAGPVAIIAAVIDHITSRTAPRLFARQFAGTAVSTMLGSPMGWSFGFAPLGGLLGPIQQHSDAAGHAVGDALGLDEYFNDAALLPVLPSTAPIPVPIP